MEVTRITITLNAQEAENQLEGSVLDILHWLENCECILGFDIEENIIDETFE